jgi:hypothetical protein
VSSSAAPVISSGAAPTVMVRAAEGARVDGISVHARLAAPGTVEVYERPSTASSRRPTRTLPGVGECLVVTRGAVRAGPADRPADLAAGDSIHHDAGQPTSTRAWNPRTKPCS